MPQIQIRPATAPDIPRLIALTAEAYSPYIERIGRKPAPMEDDFVQEVAAGEVWVIEADGDIAGLIMLSVEPDHLLIVNVAVGAGYQGRGFGRRLLGFAEGFARDKGINEQRLYTNSLMHENIAIYTKLGWEEFHRTEQNGFHRVFMRKPAPIA